jgi:Protein of unknown function (DUF3405)
MGFSFASPLRLRDMRTSKLPTYEYDRLDGAAEKDMYSDDQDSDQESDIYSEASLPSSSGSSRQTSSTRSSAVLMLPKRNLAAPRRLYFYRLPNKVVRYLCICLITTIVIFILSLVRASQVENHKLVNGELPERPQPPPSWEAFPFLTRYYGGIRSLVPLSQNRPQYPRAEDELPLERLDSNSTKESVNSRDLLSSKDFREHPSNILTKQQDSWQECFLDSNNTFRVPPIRYYEGRPEGFPDNILGSYELLGLPEDICFERYGRYGPYGFGYSVRAGGLGAGVYGDTEGSEAVWDKIPRVDYRQVDWADAQRRCYQVNVDRFKPLPPKTPPALGFFVDDDPNNAMTMQDEHGAAGETPANSTAPPTGEVSATSRTAVVIRCWDEHWFREEDTMNIRSIIQELALASGGRYDIHLLVQIKHDGLYPVWADHETVLGRLRDRIPKEFHGLVTIWTETQMLSLYQGIYDLYTRGPELPVHGVYRGLQMAMQYFAYMHPEYDYYWQWEMDIRYTGHYYDLFTKIENWAKEQPRKGLWERNARFYLPSVHGTWDDFKHTARVQSEMGTTTPDNIWKGFNSKRPEEQTKGDRVIWGPERPPAEGDWFEFESDPEPPTSYEKDKYTWGVGEEADLISFNPIFDPEGTTWLLADDITGYNKTMGNPPRRAHIITASRLSRRLLMTMHRETALKKHFAFSEMWPATVALQHGYKAVFAPHPQYVDREWPTEFFAHILNGGKNGASGGARNSVFGQKEHNMMGLTWFYNSGFAPNLYRRWLGLKVNNDGGEEFELTEDQSKDGPAVGDMRGGEGRMCLPPMLLHPVKDVDLPVEARLEGEHEVPESDPSA